jgi:hypothetical protein
MDKRIVIAVAAILGVVVLLPVLARLNRQATTKGAPGSGHEVNLLPLPHQSDEPVFDVGPDSPRIRALVVQELMMTESDANSGKNPFQTFIDKAKEFTQSAASLPLETDEDRTVAVEQFVSIFGRIPAYVYFLDSEGRTTHAWPNAKGPIGLDLGEGQSLHVGCVVPYSGWNALGSRGARQPASDAVSHPFYTKPE